MVQLEKEREEEKQHQVSIRDSLQDLVTTTLLVYKSEARVSIGTWKDSNPTF